MDFGCPPISPNPNSPNGLGLELGVGLGLGVRVRRWDWAKWVWAKWDRTRHEVRRYRGAWQRLRRGDRESASPVGRRSISVLVVETDNRGARAERRCLVGSSCEACEVESRGC